MNGEYLQKLIGTEFRFHVFYVDISAKLFNRKLFQELQFINCNVFGCVGFMRISAFVNSCLNGCLKTCDCYKFIFFPLIFRFLSRFFPLVLKVSLHFFEFNYLIG